MVAIQSYDSSMIVAKFLWQVQFVFEEAIKSGGEMKQLNMQQKMAVPPPRTYR
jgi:hypothetical protein